MATDGKPRRERRKEARLARNKKKFDSWVQHQQSQKSKKSHLDLNSDSAVKLPKDNANEEFFAPPDKLDDFKSGSNGLVAKHPASVDDSNEQPTIVMNSKSKTKSLRRKTGLSKCSGNNFTKYVQLETEGNVLSAHEDLKFERRLAKKLKVKNGRVTAANDDIDVLLDGIPSVFDSLGENEEDYKISDSDALPGRSRKSKLVNEDLDDEISGDEGSDEESDSLVASSEESDDVVEDLPEDSNKLKRRKTKFEVYLEHKTGNGENLVEADLRLERKLAKKLKLNTGDVRGEDGMDMLLDGIPSVLDRQLQNSEDYPKKSVSKSVLRTKLGDSNLSEQEQKAREKINSNTGAYVAPHLRSRGGNESEEHAQVRRRIRGLLNRLSESNVESITTEIAELYHSVGRSIGSEIISEEVVSSCAGGPRGNEQYAAVFGSFVAGMACLVGVDFGAKLLARIAKCFEEEYLKEDNLSLRNLTLLLSYVYVFGVCSSELIYDFLIMLSMRLTEVDVSTVLTVLQCCGMNLRGDDPVGMKNFILSVQSRVNEMKASSGDGQSITNNKRMEFMLETICDIKNNKKRPKEDTAQHTRVKKWLHKLRVDDILIRGLKWSKLLDPTKKGQWWLSGDMASSHSENIEDVSVKIDKEVPETKKMLQLAAAQRMNTDARRAIFCVIMSGEDYIDAFEKLLRLELTGKQDREIMRVLVDCCLQEKVFNKYYCVLANKLCSHDRNHKFTLQYCLWDHFKELESMRLIRSMHLAKFVAELIASFSISLAVLKAVDFNDPLQLTAKRIMHFRLIFEGIFEFPEDVVWNIFTRIAINPEYEPLRIGIKFFVSKYVVRAQKSLDSKFQIVRKALSNAEGVIL